jgi:heme/copper-type cytochrome/quinol oxidase subunit 1
MAIGLLVFFYNVIHSARFGKRSGPNPWNGRTLEWMIPSPPHYYNFKNIPTVYGLPYDFSHPLPYKGLEHELDDTPVGAGAH